MRIEDAKTKTGKVCVIICRTIYMLCKMAVMTVVGILIVLDKLGKHSHPPKKSTYGSSHEAEAMREYSYIDMNKYHNTIY